MVPAEFVAQDHAYRMLKLRLEHEAASWTGQINIVQLADDIGLSRTPVREALFRLVGEGVLEPAEHGGYCLYRPSVRQLGHLYMWEQQLVLAAMRLVTEDQIVRTQKAVRQRTIDLAVVEMGRVVPLLFQELGDATDNGEFSRHIRNTNERLLTARQVEPTLFADIAKEAGELLQTSENGAVVHLSQRIVQYHQRRLDRTAAISDMIRNGL